MATTTFSGPVKSQRGFVTAGPDGDGCKHHSRNYFNFQWAAHAGN